MKTITHSEGTIRADLQAEFVNVFVKNWKDREKILDIMQENFIQEGKVNWDRIKTFL